MAASVSVSISASCTAVMLATLPPPVFTPPAKVSTALPVPPLTSTWLLVPSVSLSMTTEPTSLARPPVIEELMMAATSEAVALAMSAKSAAAKLTVCSVPPSIRRVSVSPSFRA